MHTWQQAITLYLQLADQENVARLYARSGRAVWFQNEIRRSLEICQEGMQVVSGAPASPGLAGLIHETARAYFFNGIYDKAEPLCRQSLQMAEQTGALDVQADSLSTLGLLLEDTPDEAIAALTRAVDLAEAAGLLDIAFRAHINLGSAVRNFRDDLPGCRKHFMRSAEVARQRGALQEEIFALSAVASLLLHAGEMDELEPLLNEMDRLQGSMPARGQVSRQVDYLRALVMMMRGRYAESLETIRELRRDAAQRGDLVTRADLSESLVSIILEMHDLGLPCDLDEVETIASEEMAGPVSGKMTDLRTWFNLLLSRLYMYRGNLDQAARQLEEARRLVPHGHPQFKVLLAVADLEVYRARGDLSSLWSLFEVVRESQKKIFVYYYGRAMERWAQVGLERGEPEDLERAQVLLLEAIDLFTRIKNPVVLNRLQGLLLLSRDRTLAQAAAQKKVTQELLMAAKIQGSFLPEEPPRLPGWQISVAFQPARQTSGDFYDFIPLPDGRLVIVISDVADKGMGAALYMASARSLLRAYAVEFPDQPVQVISRASRRLTTDTHGGLFVTLFYGVLDPQNGELRYVNAGHNPPYLFQPAAAPLALTKTGIPLGIFDNATWTEASVNLDPGALLVMYTDGVTEAIDKAEVQFGGERLIAAVEACPGKDSLAPGVYAAQVRDCILDGISRFRGSGPQTDDITMMVIAR